MSTTGSQIPLQTACVAAQQDFRAYLEGSLTMNEGQTLQAHLNGCVACNQALAEYRKMYALMNRTIGARRLDENFDRRAEERLRNTPDKVRLPALAGRASASPTTGPTTGMVPMPVLAGEEGEQDAPPPEGFADNLTRRFGAAPWWMISGAFHALLIMLLALISMAVLRSGEKEIVIVTNLEKRPEVKPEEKQKERDVFNNPAPVEVTDAVSEQTPIVTHEEVEISDHVETANESDAGETRGEDGISDVLLGGTGTSAAIGVGGGGGGAFGRPTGAGGRMRRAIKGGGGKATESAVDKALEWLARHQEQDGHWDVVKYEAKVEGRVTGGRGDVACTGFALLAFLGAGHTEKVGKYKDNVKRAQDWLCKQLENNEKGAGEGRWFNSGGSNYVQGAGALALAEAAGMSRNPELKKWAQKAIDGVVAGQIKVGQSEYHAWDYDPRGHTNDTSVTGWNIMALKSAKVAGLHVDPAAFEGAMRWINSGQDLRNAPKGHDAEYWEGGMMTYRGQVGQAPNPKNMAMTSAAALTRLFVGGEKASDPGVAGPCNLMKKAENLPMANEGHFNLYYWYYGTLVMFQKGGDHWKAWNEAMRQVLPATQRKDGDFDGSWNPYFGEPQGHIYGGRVMSTALGALCLEVYYRYLPIYK